MPPSNIDLVNQLHEQTPTNSAQGRGLLYILEELDYKTCKDLQVYEVKEHESCRNHN